MIRKLAREVLKDLGCRDNAELSVLLTDNAGIQKLNKRYLKKDKATDVLSFPMWDFNSEPRTPNSQLILGDVVISVETAKTQAKENGVTLNQEMARLLIHGILHLLGFDHEKVRKEALRMKKEEERLLKIAKCKL
ncbi:MAG TPA: rRNA maturation RNase YbeY [Thermodesulfobacteriota bacterium]|nr:rRNA maturation RNase YbeY [Thermodesulfobacteriota bacterium]